MSEKNPRNESEPLPVNRFDRRSDDTGKESGLPKEETIRADNEESTSGSSAVDQPKSSPERQSRDDSTIIPDSKATLLPDDDEQRDPALTVPDVDKTVRMTSDQDATVDSVTIRPGPESTDLGSGRETVQASGPIQADSGPIQADNDDQIPDADPGAITVGNNDQTVAVDQPVSPSALTVRGGTTAAGESNSESEQPGAAERSVAGRPGTIMASENVGQTVNPRELSEEDATMWAAAVGTGNDEASALSPAIDRTFSDKQFDRLRRCDISDLHADRDKAGDYEIRDKLGQGGMGDVFKAKQGSLDRILALKLIKPLSGRKRAQLIRTGRLESVEEERRQQFLSEAIVTGDLDHPNIVPIHDVALTHDGKLFYSMKMVTGTPWSKKIRENSRDENLEILLKAADAVGFAHTRGVVHRDIKPENIMLGDFGVVMVMDWGLALPTSQYERQDSIFSTSGLGGTPAFMAPEMATGPIEKIGPQADIYLLGATLFLIITGVAPHQGKNVTECLSAVRANRIREAAEEQRGELMDIALRAMATDPKDRYPNVEAFQLAIRDYRAHSESIALSTRAAEDLQRGKQERSYALLSRAAFRFDEAIKSWQGNEKAHQGLAETKMVHAQAACENGDYDLGKSLLDPQNREHQPILKRLEDGIRERDSRKAKLAVLRTVAAAMLVVIIAGGGVATYLIEQERQEVSRRAESEKLAKEQAIDAEKQTKIALEAEAEAAERARIALAAEAEAAERARTAQREAEEALDVAQKARDEEQKAKEEEEIARKEAEDQKLNAEKARDDAKTAQMVAEAAQTVAEAAQTAAELARDEARRSQREAELAGKRAEYEAFVSKIALAKARLERNEADGAREILRELKENSPESAKGWEWRWLWQQANQSESIDSTESGVIDLSLGPPGRVGAAALSDGSVRLFALELDGRITNGRSLTLPRNALATSVAVSIDEQTVAVGTHSGDIVIVAVNDQSVQSLINAHQSRINDLVFAHNDLLFSGSEDTTVRAWNPIDATEWTKTNACWHILPVRKIAVTGGRSAMTLVAATADDETGQVAIWNLRQVGQGLTVGRGGTSTDHELPVTAVDISRDGTRVASGDSAGNVFLWSPSLVPSIDHAGSIQRALVKFEDLADAERPSRKTTPGRIRLTDNSGEPDDRLMSTGLATTVHAAAHDDVVKSIRFADDGRTLLTGSDDYTLKLWDVRFADDDTVSVRKTLKGHGGWVVGGQFLRGEGEVVVSGSDDSTIRSWRPERYLGAFVVQENGDQSSIRREKQAHTEQIWSASFSRDGKKIVTASDDHTARVMQIDPVTLAFQEVATLENNVLDEGTSFVAISLQVDRDNGLLYVGSADGAIRVWDLELGTQLGEATGAGLNTSFGISRRGDLMLTGSSSPDQNAILWKLDPNGRAAPDPLYSISEHQQAVTAMAISPDGRMLFTGDRAGYGLLWDSQTGQQVGRPVEDVRGFRINAASFSSDGKRLLVASDNETLTIIDVDSRQSVALAHDGFVTQVSVSDDERSVLTVSEFSTQQLLRTTARLWDLESGNGRILDQVTMQRESGRASGRNTDRITSARFDASGRLAVVSRAAISDREPATLKIWKVADVRPRSSSPAGSSSQTGASSQTQSNDAQSNDADLDLPKSHLHYRLPGVLRTAEVALLVDARTLITMNNNGAFKWDLESSKLIKSYRAHGELTEASFSFDDQFVATASRSVKIWDPATGKSVAKLESPRPIRSVQFAPAAVGPTKYLVATGGDDGVARIWSWDSDEGQLNQTHHYIVDGDAGQPPRIIRRVRFSPQGDQLLIVGDRGLVQLWNIDDPEPSVTVQTVGDGNIVSGAFSRDGQYIAVGSTDKRVRIWKVADAGSSDPIMLSGHADTVNDIAWFGVDASTVRVMTASSDDTAKVWDPRLGVSELQGETLQGREIITLRRHRGDVNAIDITADGRLLMTAGRDGAVILWPASP